MENTEPNNEPLVSSEPETIKPDIAVNEQPIVSDDNHEILPIENTASPDSIKQSNRLFKWIKDHKLIVIIVLLVVIAAALGVYWKIHSSKSNVATSSNSSTKSSLDKSASTENKVQTNASVSSTANLPEVYNPSSNYSLATETYMPPASVVGYNQSGANIRTASDDLLTSRIMVYSHETGIYTGISDAQINLYDINTQKNYILVPGGSSSAAIFNNHPMLLANNKMLFAQTTGSGNNIVTKLELMDLKTHSISTISMPFTDTSTFNAAAVAPDGTYVAYPMNNAILVLNTSTGTTKSYPVNMTGLTYSGETTYAQMAWSADSSTIYYVNQYFINHDNSDGTASFQPSNIFSLNISNSQTKQITSSKSDGYDVLQTYGSSLYFKQYTTISDSVEAYILTGATTPTVTAIPDSSDLTWPILPTSDLSEFVVVPNNDTTVNLMDFHGNLIQSIYSNMESSGKMVAQYNQSLVIGWASAQTLLIAEIRSNNTQDVYSYNVQTKAISLVLQAAPNQ